MAVSAVKVRGFIGAVFAAVATTAMGMNIPILRDIAGALRFSGG